MKCLQTEVNSYLKLTLDRAKELVSPKLTVKLELKSLILAQIERWRHA